MKILLATYNFYPYNFGGSEVYVFSLAEYLKTIGYEPTIIAASPEKAFDEHPVIFNDEHLKVCNYNYKGLSIWGVHYAHISLESIYSKRSPGLKNSWRSFLHSQEQFDLLHLNGFTTTIGLDFLETARELNHNLKIITSYHTPLSCPKGSLLYANQKKECEVTPDTNTCTACYLSEKLSLPLAASKLFTNALPAFTKGNAGIRIKNLINHSIESFRSLDNLTDQWVVYSEGIKNILKLNGIRDEKIFHLRHGIASFFSEERVEERNTMPVEFLFSGRIDPVKGFHTLLKAWLSLPESKERMLLVTAHPSTEKNELEHLLNEARERKDIQFLGPLTQAELLQCYQQVHCVIIPSECFEIGPLVFHEAIAMGCNVISSDIGGCRELGNIYQPESTFFECGNETDLGLAILNFKYKQPSAHSIFTSSEHNQRISEEYGITANESI